MKPRRYMSKKDMVVETIREAILSAEYKPGDRLLQNKLARQLDVSPTPVREALRELEAEGILYHRPNKGVCVAEVKLEDMREIYLIRSVLESLATESAVARLTTPQIERIWSLQKQIEARIEAQQLPELRALNYELHMAIYEAADMEDLLRLIQGYWTRFPWDTLHVIPERAAESAREHDEILRAIEARDAELAGKLMKQHIENGAEKVRSYLAEQEAKQGE